ncbi:DUF3019 domain-containing protein [Pseudoalteromonas sp. JBTF-M23]|uniref:DUF3019 domain-containing protein n=1 Tax=Pseudoalteromonas caenipelagi TaxID=2726988 RepID=A0A849VBK9_9GAMM|nr:DUF3019 domain-containing protein [Pseudoalteromonas caenipelagi]NOU50395.1 DUF3019 domain-containing protein [Pseudoalteromonas caenipelagi]
MNFKAYFVVALVLVINLTKPLAAGTNSGQTLLEIKPVTCIVRQMGELCQMTIKLHWFSSSAIDACLYQEQLKLRCWQTKQQINEQLDISLQKNMNFRLIDSKNVVLAQQLINVNAAVSRQYRRKLKTDWSIF